MVVACGTILQNEGKLLKIRPGRWLIQESYKQKSILNKNISGVIWKKNDWAANDRIEKMFDELMGLRGHEDLGNFKSI